MTSRRLAQESDDEGESASEEEQRAVGPFGWLNGKTYMDASDLVDWGFVIVPLLADEGQQISDHMMRDIIVNGDVAHKDIFHMDGGYQKTVGKHHLLDYFRNLTAVPLENLTPKQQTEHAERDTKPFVAPAAGKPWQAKHVYSKLNLLSLARFKWPRHGSAVTPNGTLLAVLQKAVTKHQKAFCQKEGMLQAEIVEYNASIPHKAPKHPNLIPMVPKQLEGISYVGHLAATDITFCFIQGSHEKTHTAYDVAAKVGAKAGLLINQKVITIPAGHALIHHPGLVFVPVHELFRALNTVHLWECTFHLTHGAGALPPSDIPDVSDEEGPPAAKKRKGSVAAPKAPSVYFGPSRVSTGSAHRAYASNPQNYAIARHANEIEALTEHIKQMTDAMDAPGVSEFQKDNTLHQIARLQETLRNARAEAAA